MNAENQTLKNYLERQSTPWLLKTLDQLEAGTPLEGDATLLSCELMQLSVEDLKQSMYAEFGRRTYQERKLPNLKRGMDIWYREDGVVEHGTVYNAYYKNGSLDAISVNFDNGDFDEFYGSAYLSVLFPTLGEAGEN